MLWHNDEPLLIDWESARLLNPTQEILNAALDWSGITTVFNENIFDTMIKAYQQAGGVIVNETLEAAFYGILGNWINWMVYNIERSFKTRSDEAQQQKLGIEQVMMVLKVIVSINSIKDLHDA